MRRVRAASAPNSDQASNPRASRIPGEDEVISNPCGVESHHLVALHLLQRGPNCPAGGKSCRSAEDGSSQADLVQRIEGIVLGTYTTLPNPTPRHSSRSLDSGSPSVPRPAPPCASEVVMQ